MERILEINKGLDQAIILQQFDRNSEKITIKIESGLYKYNLTGLTASLNGVKADGNYILIPVVITNAAEGIIEIDIIEQMTVVGGTLTLQFMLLGANSKIINTTMFSLFVKKSIEVGTPVISTNDFQLLSEKLIEVQGWNDYFTTANGLLEEKYTTRLGGIDEQLADRATKTELASVASGSPKGAYTTLELLQSAFPTGTTGTYVVAPALYSWSGSAWVIIVANYQATVSTEFPATNKITNGDFNNGTTGWSGAGATSTVTSKVLTNTSSGTNSSPTLRQTISNGYVSGHVYYFKFKVRVTNSSCTNLYTQYLDAIPSGKGTDYFQTNPVINTWYDVSILKTLVAGTAGNMMLDITHKYIDSATANGKQMEVQYVLAIDLTATFGAGFEPTKEVMENMLSKHTNSWFNATVSPFINQKELYSNYRDLSTQYLALNETVDNVVETIGTNVVTQMKIQLPDVINLVVGEEFNIYFENIINHYQAFKNGNFYIAHQYKLGANYGTYGENNGTKWFYTPSAVETFDVEFRIINTYTGEVITSKLVTFKATNKALVTPKSITMVTVGDSFVDGKVGGEIYNALTQSANLTVNMIGLHNTTVPIAKDDGWSGKSYDFFYATAEGELVVGRAGSDLDSTPNQFYNPATSKFDFSYYMATYQANAHVDYFTSMLGINDAMWITPTELKTKLEYYKIVINHFITSVKTYDNNIKLLLTLIQHQGSNNVYINSYLHNWNNENRSKYSQEIWNQFILDNFNTISMRNNGVFIIPANAHFDTQYSLITETYKPCKFEDTIIMPICKEIHPNLIGAKYIADTVRNTILGTLN